MSGRTDSKVARSREAGRGREAAAEVQESVEWTYARGLHTAGREAVTEGVTKYKVYRVAWTIPDFRRRLNSLRPGVRCWHTVALGDQRVSLTVERSVAYRQPRPRTNLPVEYDDWLDLGLRNVGEEILWVAGVEATLGPEDLNLTRQVGAVDLHQNERLAGLTRFAKVDRLKSCVLGGASPALEVVWVVRVESGGPRPAPGQLAEDRGVLASHMWGLFTESLLTDYTLVCGGQEVKVHRALLAARSEYWRALLTSGMVEAAEATAEVRAVSRPTLHLLLEFLYTGRVAARLEPRQMEQLLEAADFFGVSSLKEQCEEGLILSLEPANLVERLVLGDTYSAAQLRRVAKQMLVANIDLLQHSPDWKARLEVRVGLLLEVVEDLATAKAREVGRSGGGGAPEEENLRDSPESPAGDSPESPDEEEYQEFHVDEGEQEHDLQHLLINNGVPVAQLVD